MPTEPQEDMVLLCKNKYNEIQKLGALAKAMEAQVKAMDIQAQINKRLDFMLSAHWSELDKNTYDEYYDLLMNMEDLWEYCDGATVSKWWVWAEDTECPED